jgi:hypothetical protein
VALFHTELYGLDRYRNIQKSTSTFPDYAVELNQVLLEADLMFFNEIYETDGGVTDIFTSPVVYMNDQISGFYGIEPPAAPGPFGPQPTGGDELRREELDDRPGYLTRVGFLAYNATLSLPDPIHRGVDINNRMLCEELNPPPGTIPPLPEPKPGQTNRERVTDHTSEGVCANCHMKIINPLGFAFEGFDAMGQVQTMDNGNVIDTADEYEFNDGIKPFEDAAGLIDLLIENKQTHACYTSRLAEYVLGRDVASGDEGLVTSTQEASSENAASIKELILAMVIDPKFTNAQGEAQ